MDQTRLKETFSENLKKTIKEKGITQSALATMSETSQQNISKYCKGNALPDLGTVANIAESLQVSVDSLLGLDCVASSNTTKSSSLADYLRDFVSIADTLNLDVSTVVFRTQELARTQIDFDVISCNLGLFIERWKKYRCLLEDEDIDFSDYKTLIETQLKNLMVIDIAKDELLEQYISIKR